MSRTEDIHAKPFVPPGIAESDMRCDVDVTELMGNEINLYLLTGTKGFIARVDPRTSVRPGDQPTCWPSACCRSSFRVPSART